MPIKHDGYGRAINGISFQTRILLKFDGYEYTAWYDTTGSCIGMVFLIPNNR